MNKLGKLTIYLILLVTLTYSTFAIGVSPASTSINFEPGLNKTVAIRILNNEHKDFNALIDVHGDLEEYITLSQNSIDVSADEDTKTFTYNVNLPDSLNKPGSHVTEILIAEQAAESSKETVVSARPAVISQLIVDVPYPGTYAEANIHISKANAGEDTQFAIAVFNLGKEDLQKIYAKIDIYESTNKIETIETNKLDIQSKQKSKVEATWKSDKTGRYTVIATLYYADKIIRLEQDFEVGGANIAIGDLNVYDFKLGEIVKMYLFVTNNWNEKLSDVYGETIIRDESTKEISRFKSLTTDIGALSESPLTFYWDTKNMIPGKYSIETDVNYLGLQTAKLFGAEVYPTEIIITSGDLTGRAVSVTPSAIKPTGITILIIIALNLVVLNIVLLIYLKKRPPKIIEREREFLTRLLLFLQ